jgi:hypothetical protein
MSDFRHGEKDELTSKIVIGPARALIRPAPVEVSRRSHEGRSNWRKWNGSRGSNMNDEWAEDGRLQLLTIVFKTLDRLT